MKSQCFRCSGKLIIPNLPTGAMNLRRCVLSGKVHVFRIAGRRGKLATIGGARKSLPFPMWRRVCRLARGICDTSHVNRRRLWKECVWPKREAGGKGLPTGTKDLQRKQPANLLDLRCSEEFTVSDLATVCRQARGMCNKSIPNGRGPRK